MTELERYLRVYLTTRISLLEHQIKQTREFLIDIPNASEIILKLNTRIESFKEILDQLDLHKDIT